MSKAKIKICGIKNKDHIKEIANYGAHYIGLVFHEESKRYIEPKEASYIAQAAREYHLEPVAVFTHHTASEMQKIIDLLDLKTIQLHGEKSLAEQKNLSKDIARIYAFHVHENGEFEERPSILKNFRKSRDYLLYDGMVPGSGKFFSWKDFEPIEGYDFFLAGGLTSSRVKEALHHTHPFAVDVSSGVEDAKGEKCIKKIKAFIDEVNSVYV
ncbi:MAG: N-(5'-phosphoribosyl)anthranilate isomerase [Chlamydiia bacterium]|nr:N-(5'-phosphoribosyl)anthranilate isomerase [Chlamydiia bacterium]